jgi:hypothetical protein
MGGLGEAPGDFAFYFLAPRNSLFIPAQITISRNDECSETALAVAEDRRLIDERRRRKQRFNMCGGDLFAGREDNQLLFAAADSDEAIGPG